MTEKLYKNVNGIRIELTEEEIQEYLKRQEKNKPSIDELKQEKIQQLRTNCSNYIYNKYPIYKQLNIANGIYDEEARSDEEIIMKAFIQQARLVYSEKEELIKKAESVEELKNIDINFKD